VQSAQAPSRATLLAIDDVPLNLDWKRSIFEPLGYRVITADTAPLGCNCPEQNARFDHSDIGLGADGWL